MIKTVYVGYENYGYDGNSVPLIVTTTLQEIEDWASKSSLFRDYVELEIETEEAE